MSAPQPMPGHPDTCALCWSPIIDCTECGAARVWCACDASVENHVCLEPLPPSYYAVVGPFKWRGAPRYELCRVIDGRMMAGFAKVRTLTDAVRVAKAQRTVDSSASRDQQPERASWPIIHTTTGERL